MEKRSFEIDVGSIRAESRTVEASLSSEFPVKRFDGEEVLSHKPGAIDLSRAPLPLLRSHNVNELPVGTVENLKVEGGKLRGTIRLSANEDGLWKDIQDLIVRNLSIGYRILERVKTKTGFIATKWLPYECSLVAAPADNTVGINRSLTTKKENKIMDLNDIKKAKKAAIEELSELAKSGEDLERMETLKTEIRALDARSEAFEISEQGKKDTKGFVPDIKKVDRSIIEMGSGPVNRSFAGMFNQGKPLEVNEEEIRAFRASMLEGTPSLGGFSVPEILSAKWLDESLPDEIIRPRCQVWPMESATKKIPGWDGNDQAGGILFGGFSLERIAEEAAGTPQVGKLRLIELIARKFGIFVTISSELSEDGQDFNAQLERAMKASIGYGLDNLFINGSAGEPLGIRNDPAKITVARESGQAATGVIYDNLTKIFARMYPAGRLRGVFMANDTLIPALLTMSIAIGTGGSHIPVMTKGANGFEILTRPVVFTSHLPAAGADQVMFVDLNNFSIGMRRDIRLEKSIIPGWQNDLVSFRAMLRCDGMGTWNKAITPKNGDSLSWCVSLA